MWSSLKNQLLITSIGALALLLLGVWFVTRGFVNLAITMMVFACVYIIGLNLWFWYFVTDPLAELTRFSKHIAEGSYGVKLENAGTDEIGKLTEEINNIGNILLNFFILLYHFPFANPIISQNGLNQNSSRLKFYILYVITVSTNCVFINCLR